MLNGTANRLLRLMGIDPPGETERLHSPEEIRMLVEQSTEGGSLLKQDARLLEGVFEFSEKTAQEVMTPRTQMVALEADLTVERAADEVAEAGRSRYPVYTDSLDEIVGVVHAKDILAALRSRPGSTVRQIMRPPLFVPGTREVEDVLADMKRLKTHLAVVLDEYGGTAGLVTMEDLLEEIVGPIYDEYDPQEARSRAGGAPLLDGAMPISEFNSEYGESLDDTDYTTIGGYVFGQLGRLPRPGDRVKAGPHALEVVEMEGRRVKIAPPASRRARHQARSRVPGRRPGEPSLLRSTSVSTREHPRAELSAALLDLGYRLAGVSTPQEAARIIAAVAQDVLGWDAYSLDLYVAGQRHGTGGREHGPRGRRRAGGRAARLPLGPGRRDDSEGGGRGRPADPARGTGRPASRASVPFGESTARRHRSCSSRSVTAIGSPAFSRSRATRPTRTTAATSPCCRRWRITAAARSSGSGSRRRCGRAGSSSSGRRRSRWS